MSDTVRNLEDVRKQKQKDVEKKMSIKFVVFEETSRECFQHHIDVSWLRVVHWEDNKRGIVDGQVASLGLVDDDQTFKVGVVNEFLDCLVYIPNTKLPYKYTVRPQFERKILQGLAETIPGVKVFEKFALEVLTDQPLKMPFDRDEILRTSTAEILEDQVSV